MSAVAVCELFVSLFVYNLRCSSNICLITVTLLASTRCSGYSSSGTMGTLSCTDELEAKSYAQVTINVWYLFYISEVQRITLVPVLATLDTSIHIEVTINR